MTEKKEPMGFATPARELERALTQIHDDLSEKKADWKSLQDHLFSLAKKTTKQVTDQKASTTDVIFPSCLLIATLVAKLGVELIETHDRLAKVEKAIKESKLGK